MKNFLIAVGLYLLAGVGLAFVWPVTFGGLGFLYWPLGLARKLGLLPTPGTVTVPVDYQGNPSPGPGFELGGDLIGRSIWLPAGSIS